MSWKHVQGVFFPMCLYKLMQSHDTQIVNLVHKWAKQWHRNTNLKIYFPDETEYIGFTYM